MLGGSSTAAATLSTSPTPSSSRPGRLRGLSYLRNYTHLHHSSTSASRLTTPAPLTRSITSPDNTNIIPSPSPSPRPASRGERDGGAPSPRRSNTTLGHPTSGWVPTVGGQSGITPVAATPQATSTDSSGGETQPTMTRTRAETVVEQSSGSMTDGIARPSTPRSQSTGAADAVMGEETDKKSQLPTIRLIPHHDARASRPSLTFPIINRTLPTDEAIIRVGRYSERDNQAATLEAGPNTTTPVGFKSKVVSRRHCEFWCTENQWYIKDVKSSSGTFLNHVRLSSAGTESKPYPVNDGDIVQLGIDFKGGEEVIFRCVKIRIECNRSWQKAINQFNTNTHKRLRNLASASKDSDAASVNSSECSICLNPVAPCQALFVAPCSHVWHYKCIRTLIYPDWPSFQCPNCRAYADLEADIEELQESESDTDLMNAIHASQVSAANATPANTGTAPNQLQHSSTRQTLLESEGDGDDELSSAMAGTSLRDPTRPRSRNHSGSSRQIGVAPTAPLAIPTTPSGSRAAQDIMSARSATPTSTAPFALAADVISPGVDALSTPRNEAGPFVLDTTIDGVVQTSARSRRKPTPTSAAVAAQEADDSVEETITTPDDVD